jgi:hypothetical protein
MGREEMQQQQQQIPPIMGVVPQQEYYYPPQGVIQSNDFQMANTIVVQGGPQQTEDIPGLIATIAL